MMLNQKEMPLLLFISTSFLFILPPLFHLLLHRESDKTSSIDKKHVYRFLSIASVGMIAFLSADFIFPAEYAYYAFVGIFICYETALYFAYKKCNPSPAVQVSTANGK